MWEEFNHYKHIEKRNIMVIRSLKINQQGIELINPIIVYFLLVLA